MFAAPPLASVVCNVHTVRSVLLSGIPIQQFAQPQWTETQTKYAIPETITLVTIDGPRKDFIKNRNYTIIHNK